MTTRSASKPKPPKTYLVGRPVSTQSSVTGRSTKAFVGFDLEEKRLCFIKDCWRPLANRIRPEWEVYKRLSEYGVKWVATAAAGGDVGSPDNRQLTVTQDHIPDDGNPKPVQRAHCRLVTREVGRALDTYRDSAELMLLTSHALLGSHIFRISYKHPAELF